MADDHRRYRLTRVLLDYGERIQESVFWIDCEDDLARVLAVTLDNFWMVPLCGACTKRVETMGIVRKPEIPRYFIV